MNKIELAELGALVRERFPAADGVRYGHDHGDVMLWQVLAGNEVVWDAGPGVIEQIPQWHKLGEAVEALGGALNDSTECGDWLVLRLP